MTSSRRATIAALACVFGAAACVDLGAEADPERRNDASTVSDSGDAGRDGAVNDEELDYGARLAASGFVQEPYAIGQDWYDYDPRTHTLTPTPRVYWARRGAARALFVIESYYDERGESGYFRGQARWADEKDEAWSDPSAWSIETSVKEEPGCLRLAPFESVSCQSPEAALVLRTAWRPVPGAGFAVSEPALYERSGLKRPAPAIGWFDGGTLQSASLEQVESAKAKPSSAREEEDALIGVVKEAPGATYVQLEAQMNIAQWRVERIEQDAITFSARCAPILGEAGRSMPAEARTLTLRLARPAPGAYAGTLLQLCDEGGAFAGAESGRIDEPWGGLWPDTKTFDLLVERGAAGWALRPAPGTLIANWSALVGAGPKEDPGPASIDEVGARVDR